MEIDQNLQINLLHAYQKGFLYICRYVFDYIFCKLKD